MIYTFLFDQREKIERIIGTTDIISVYSFTFVGYIIALLVELTEPGKQRAPAKAL